LAINTETVVYEGPHGPLEGVMAFDDAASGRRPGVLIVHTALGRGVYETEVAEALARQGYAAFAADLYGQGILPGGVDDGIERARRVIADPEQKATHASLAALRRHPAVDPARIAAMGYCLGGKIVLDLARAGASVAGVISLHGGLNPAPWPSVTPIKPKVLVLHGWDDPYAPPEHVTALAKELTAAGADWQIHAYGQTGHAFTNRHEPHTDVGVAYSADADRRSWKTICDFLGELF
jgi:dienelactone hydrolase